MLTSHNFVVSIDTPFRGGGKTISSFSRNLNKNMWALQIEINCAITNNPKNKEQFLTLLSILKKWINSLN